ncbi:hypothetical protein M0802_008668 [Mischocyttarus mexicanus]|nr:hypothetical protein M0802_008668 [Mischocyttarus mexicanus]
MDLSNLLQEIQICKENVSTYKKLIILNYSLNHSLSKKNTEEWQLILSNIMESLANNQDVVKEWTLLASHAFFMLQLAQSDPESLQKCLTYFLEVHSSELFFNNKTYKIIHLELFKLIIISGYLQVNQKDIYSNNILCIMFKVIHPYCMQYTPYSYLAYKILNTWLNRSVYIDFWNTNTLLIEQQLEMIIFSNWDNSINDINKQNVGSILNTYLKIMTEKYNGFLEYIFDNVNNVSWQKETKYIILAEVFLISKSRIVKIISENFLLNLSTSLTNNRLYRYGAKVYLNILNRLTEEDWKRSFSTVIKYLICQWEIEPKKNYNALKSLCKYWLEPTIAKYQNIILHLWELCKDLATPFFHSNLQRIANEMYVTFPQDIDIISYIRHKDEDIRLNGFAIYCYQFSKSYNKDQINDIIIIKQFLWYNAKLCISKQDSYDEALKMYVKNLLDDKTLNTLNITRRGAGFSLMFHKIVSNDDRKGRPLLHFAIQELLYSLENFSDIQYENIDHKYDLPLGRHLFFLHALVTDKDLHVQLTSYMERISLICFRYLKSEIWLIRNASVQLFGSLVPRLVGQNIGGTDLDFGNGYHVNHFISHYPKLTKHILKQLQILSKLSENSNTVLLHEYSNIIHILILLSKFSIIGCNFIDYPSYDFIKELKCNFIRLLGNPIGYVRLLTAKTYAALTAFSSIKSEIEILKLNISSMKNVNTIHGHLLTIKYLEEKFLTEAESVDSYETMKSTIFFTEGKSISEYRIMNIMKIWNDKLKIKSNEQIYYTLECTLIELFNLKSFPLNIELFDKIMLDSLNVLHIENIKPNFYQFIDILTYLYACHIKSTSKFNFNVIDKIIHSRYINQAINFLSNLHDFIPILEIILHILLSIIDNGNELIINAMIKFIITTFKSLSLTDIYELKLDEMVLNLIDKLDENTSNMNLLHLKYVLISIFSKDDNVIYKILSTIFNMCLSNNEHVQNEAFELLQFLVQRFSKVEYKNKLIMMHCCLILLKNHTYKIHDSVNIIVQNYMLTNIYNDKKIFEHGEIIYQQLLLEIVHNVSSYNYSYLNDNIEFIRQFIGLDKFYKKHLSSSIENPFDHDHNTYKEETKFMNILYFYVQSDTKYCCTIKYERNNKNYIDVSGKIKSKYQILEKTDLDLNCIENLLTIEDEEYLFKKQEVLIEEFKNKNQ